MAEVANMSLDQIGSEVTSLIAEIIEVPEGELDPDASFIDDLDVDSLMALEIVANIEKKYRDQAPLLIHNWRAIFW